MSEITKLNYILSHNSNIWDRNNYDNSLCLWYCLAHALYSPPNQKVHNAKAIEMLCKFSDVDNGNIKNKNREAIQFARNYKGFYGDPTDVCNKFNISITVWGVEYRSELKAYYEVLDAYKPKTEAESETDTKHVNLLLLSKEQNNGCEHFMYIKNAELLTGMWLCPHCKNHIIHTDGSKSHLKRDKEAHLKICMKKIDKLILDSDANPYIPQYTKNKLLTFCITYDFETGDREGIQKDVTILEPIVVSMTVYNGIIITESLSFDIRERNWIEKFVNTLYDKS